MFVDKFIYLINGTRFINEMLLYFENFKDKTVTLEKNVCRFGDKCLLKWQTKDKRSKHHNYLFKLFLLFPLFFHSFITLFYLT